MTNKLINLEVEIYEKTLSVCLKNQKTHTVPKTDTVFLNTKGCSSHLKTSAYHCYIDNMLENM